MTLPGLVVSGPGAAAALGSGEDVDMEPTREVPQEHSEAVSEPPAQLEERIAEPELGPVRPSDEVRAELVELLQRDESRTGDVFRGLAQGLTADEIATDLGISTSNFVWNYDRVGRALVDGDLPTAPTVALAAARKFRAVLKTARLSPPARRFLELNLAELERRANDETARVVEVQRAQEHTEVAEARNDVGIYVYALPHYLRYPFDSTSGRTLMKVGRSDSDVIIRFRNQTRTTALPEEPILLRIYRTDAHSTAPIESNFHRLLEAADHHRSVARTAGREWFVTSTRFLDEVARVMGLGLVIVNESDAADSD